MRSKRRGSGSPRPRCAGSPRRPCTSLLTAANAIDEPFGDGSTSRVSASTSSRLAGDSVGPRASRGCRRAPRRCRGPAGGRSRHPCAARRVAPRSTAMVSAVEKDSTSTTTTTSLLLGQRAGADRSPLERDRHAPERTRQRCRGPGRARRSLPVSRRRLGQLQPAVLERGPLVVQGAQARVEREHPLVVGRGGRHVGRAAGPRGRAACLQLPLQPGQLLARRAHRRRVRPCGPLPAWTSPGSRRR